MNDNNDKIINFPNQKERKAREEEFRKQYKQQQKAQKTPFINWNKIPLFTRLILAGLIIIHIVVAFALDDTQTLWLIYNFGFAPANFTGAAPWSWSAPLTLITTFFLHGSWMHLMFNTVMLLIMGIFCERTYGAKATAITFLLCGLAGNLGFAILTPTSSAPVIGASGAISGLFAVAFLTMIERGLLGPEIERRRPLPFILLWCTVIIAAGFISTDTAWQSHLGGFLGGIALIQLQRKDIINVL